MKNFNSQGNTRGGRSSGKPSKNLRHSAAGLYFKNLKKLKKKNKFQRTVLEIDFTGLEEFIEKKEERELLRKHFTFMIGLLSRKIEPIEDRHKNFIRIINGNLPPEDIFQKVFRKYLDFYSHNNHKNLDFIFNRI